MPPAADGRDEGSRQLEALREEVSASPCCALGETRTRLVFGEGDPQADVMFVGEAPGYHEDQQGRPFVGQAGKLLEQLLAAIGLTRQQVYIANVLKCRPPNNRDPLPAEVSACEPYLWRQIEIIQPRVICSLGNHATKLLSGKPLGITKVRGRPQAVRLGSRMVYLYPIFHPAAALYTPAMLTTLKEDFARIPEVLALPLPREAETPIATLGDALSDGYGSEAVRERTGAGRAGGEAGRAEAEAGIGPPGLFETPATAALPPEEVAEEVPVSGPSGQLGLF